MDILTLPTDLLALSSKLFIDGIEERAKLSIEFAKNKYPKSELLYKAIEFARSDFISMMKCDFLHLDKIGTFPIIEAELELQHAINHALIGSYKAAFSDLRRSLEMTLVIPFFTKENYDNLIGATFEHDGTETFFEKLLDLMHNEENLNWVTVYDAKPAQDWIAGDAKTPNFSDILNVLTKDGRFKEINDTCKWRVNLSNFYHAICGYVHNKGYRKSYEELNNPSVNISSIQLPTINYKTLETFLDLYIETLQQNIVILCLYNPLVLEGLPIESKFGINEPASGYFCHYQSDLLWELLPSQYHAFFEKIKNTDPEVLDVVKWVIDRPDVTEEEF